MKLLKCGTKNNRTRLETAIDFVRSGDTLVVWID